MNRITNPETLNPYCMAGPMILTMQLLQTVSDTSALKKFIARYIHCPPPIPITLITIGDPKIITCLVIVSKTVSILHNKKKKENIFDRIFLVIF